MYENTIIAVKANAVSLDFFKGNLTEEQMQHLIETFT